MKFRELQHTGDIAYEIYGSTKEELFQNGALALYRAMLERANKIEPKEKIKIETDANDIEELMINWLNELNFITDTKQLIFGKFEIKEIKNDKIKAYAYGEKYNPEKHGEIIGIKAVTYHRNENSIKKEKGKYKCLIIFDI